MSGFEIAVGVLALLESAISATKTLHEAYNRQKDLPEVCDRLQDKLESIRDIIKIVKDEEVLRTPSVISQLEKLHRSSKMVKTVLQSIDPLKKGTARVFFHQVFKGSSDEKKMTEIIGDLEGEKTSLILTVQVVGVGLKKDHDQNITFVTTASAKRIDVILRERLHLQDGLRIMRIIEDRKSVDKVPLTEEDLDSLRTCMEQIVKDQKQTVEGRKPTTERIILDNVAKFQATQINAPLGEDIWANIDRLVVENNRADALSTQINYPMTLGAFYSGVIPQLVFFAFLSFALYFPLSYYF